MYAYTYRAFWREVGATAWNEIQSPSPITWEQVEIPAVPASPGVVGGQCPAQYTVRYEVRFRNSSATSGGPWNAWTVATTLIQSSAYYGPIEYPVKIITVRTLASVHNRDIKFELATRTAAGVREVKYLNLGGSSTRQFHTNNGESWEFRNFTVAKVSGVDNCGNSPGYSAGTPASCITTFNTGLIVERPLCIEITTAPPECECCTELLPKANSILARLG